MDKLILESFYLRYSKAFKECDWDELSECGDQFRRLLGESQKSNILDVKDIAQKYLGSMVGAGRFLFTKSRNDDLDQFEIGLKFIEEEIIGKSKSIESTLLPVLKSAYELQLFLLKPQADNLNKAGAALRVIARPDLAIELTSIQIEKSRLNYFSRNIRAAAYSDLGDFSAAINDASIALKYAPKDKANFLHVTLARAFVNRFKKTGDLEDSEKAFFHAEEAFKGKPDNYSANIFLKVIYALGSTGLEDLIVSLEKVRKNPLNPLDLNALKIAREVIRKSRNTSSDSTQDYDDETLIDSWFDDFSEFDDETDDSLDDDADSISDYFEEYFEEYSESLNDPQKPHLEP